MLRKVLSLVVLSACLFMVGCSQKENVVKAVKSPESVSKAVTAGSNTLKVTSEVYDIINALTDASGDYYLTKDNGTNGVRPLKIDGPNIKKLTKLSYVKLSSSTDSNFSGPNGEKYTQIN